MKKFAQHINEVSTRKLVDYVAKASQDVGRRIEKAEPGAKPFKKILDRSGKIGRAKAHIQMKTNEGVSEGTVDDKISKVAKIYNAHRALADKARQVGVGKKRDPEAEAHHMTKSSKAFGIMQKLRKGSSEANKANPKPRPKEHDHGAAIAQDYKDQEARRGIGHVRDDVELNGTMVEDACRVCGQTPCNCTSVSELKDSTLKSYIRQSSGDVTNMQNAANRSGMSDKIRAAIKKRNAGQATAQRKLGEESVDQDQETVNELRVSTLLRYNTKAHASSRKLGVSAARAMDTGDTEKWAKDANKRDSRDKGILRSAMKLRNKTTKQG